MIRVIGDNIFYNGEQVGKIDASPGSVREDFINIIDGKSIPIIRKHFGDCGTKCVICNDYIELPHCDSCLQGD